MVWKALKFFMSSVISMALGLLGWLLTGMTSPASCTALDTSSAVASPFLGFLAFRGKRTSLLLYSFRRWAFSWRDSTLLFLLLRPILRAGWLNQVFTYLCQSLWKWPLGTMLFLLAGILSLVEVNQAIIA